MRIPAAHHFQPLVRGVRRGPGVAAGVIFVAGAMLAACSGGSNSASKNATQSHANLCGSVEGLQASIGTVTAIDPRTATTGDLKAAASNVGTDLNSVKQSAKEAANVRSDALGAAVDQLRSTIDNLSSSTTLTAALQEIQPELKGVADALRGFVTAVPCDTSQGKTP